MASRHGELVVVRLAIIFIVFRGVCIPKTFVLSPASAVKASSPASIWCFARVVASPDTTRVSCAGGASCLIPRLWAGRGKCADSIIVFSNAGKAGARLLPEGFPSRLIDFPEVSCCLNLDG